MAGFLSKERFQYFWNKLKPMLNGKQDTLVSGTNIKTINNESLLGSGNIDIQSGGSNVFEITYGTTTFSELYASDPNNTIYIMNNGDVHYQVDMVFKINTIIHFYADIAGYVNQYSVDNNNNWKVSQYGLALATKLATDNDLGLVKLNSSESITLNSDGQLDVGGRLGQFSGTTGIYHSKDREPRKVGDFTLLITDAKGMESAGPRNLTLLTGNNLSLNGSHAAGSTQYKVANNYANRIICAGIKYIALNEAGAKQTQVIKVTSVTIGGSAYTPSSANDSSNPIIITAESSVNPSSAITQIRVFSAVGTGSYCSEYVGQCVGGDAGGDGLAIGQNVFNKSGNMTAMVGQSIFNTGNGNAIFGRQHISRKNRSFLAGTGHDTTNAKSEGVSAFGDWSDLSSPEILFAVGDGTSHTDRSNALEVRNKCIVLKSPNGTKWKITVDNNGNLITTAI